MVRLMRYPKDDDNRKTGTRERALTFAALNTDHWEFHEITGTDHSTDCVFELIEEDEYRNHSIHGQIKGTREIEPLAGSRVVSKPIETKLINYALSSPVAFVIFLADVSKEVVYYLPVQDYFIANPNYYDKLDTTQKTINLHFPLDNVLSAEDADLQEIAKSQYLRSGSGKVSIVHIEE